MDLIDDISDFFRQPSAVDDRSFGVVYQQARDSIETTSALLHTRYKLFQARSSKRKASKMKTVLLSFDLEEFDMPKEYAKSIDFSEQIRVSAEGTQIILDLLLQNDIKATFFSTVVFATHAGSLIKRIINEGHELASHGYYHSVFEEKHLLESKQ